MFSTAISSSRVSEIFRLLAGVGCVEIARQTAANTLRRVRDGSSRTLDQNGLMMCRDDCAKEE